MAPYKPKYRPMPSTPPGAKRRASLAALLAAAAAVGLAPAVKAASPPPPFTARLLHFDVHIGPGRAKTCDMVGELFTPAGADTQHRVPAILTTNGFGGSYTDQVGMAEAFARIGYATLTYSGLGFGGSGCQITLDDPAYDGEAASQLVSFLGGENGIAFADAAHTVPVPGADFIVHDGRDHAGRADRYDPRVGMIGGSYGGEIQFAAAADDPRIDTIIPLITWSNLNYSLAPNDAGLEPGRPVSTSTPGAAKSTWALLFSADGVLDGLEGAPSDPARLAPCPNFATWVCPGLLASGTTGFPDAATAADLAHASVATYMSRVRIPTLLMQGENDTLFNLNEAVANYAALKAQGTPVSMVWQSWGHSGGTPAPGELSLSNPDPATQYETARIEAWFARYLKGQNVSTGPGFAYFRDWISYRGVATPAYGAAPAYPVGHTLPLYLSGSALATSRANAVGGTQDFLTSPLGLPAGTAPLDAVGGAVGPVGSLPSRNLPGTFASWSTPALSRAVDVAGIPVLNLRLLAPTAAVTEAGGPAGDLVIFAKLYDVAPDGTASLIHGLVAPARIADVNQPVHITLPGVVHRFAPGHRIELVLSGGDVNYRGGLLPTAVVVASGASQVLDLPVVAG